MSEIQNKIKELQKEIESVVNKEKCFCGKTLFFYDETYIYIKCKHCGKTKKFKR